MAVEGNLRRTHMHFGPGQLGRVFLANDTESYKVKYNEYPKYEPVPLKTDEDCCCCCGCECTCSMDILGEVIDLTDFTCELSQSFCFVKHQPATSVIEATQCEEYTTPLECGEYPAIGGIQRRIVKESRMHTDIVSFIKATVTKGGPWSIEVEQTDKVMTFYYRRITVTSSEVCTIAADEWRLNATTGVPELIGPISCPLPKCTDETSEINCEFSVVDGIGRITTTSTIRGLWEYEEGKCMDPALTGPNVSCKDEETGNKFYELNSHTWDDARNGRVGCLSPVMEGLGCAGETLRVRRKTWRFVPLLPVYDNDDIPDSQCLSYQKGNVAIELMETYDSRTLALYAGETFELDYEVSLECDTDLEFDPNTQPHQILGTPVEVGGAIDTVELSADVAFHYAPQAPKCSQCMMTIEIGVDTVELMEPGCFGSGEFCYYNMSLIATYESVHKRITDPLFHCLQVASGEDCDYTGADEGIYFETNTEHKERFYVNSSSICRIRSETSGGETYWIAEIEQDDHLVQIAYRRKIYIIDFGSGCFYNNCGIITDEESDNCGSIIPLLYDVYAYPPLVGGTPSACFFASDDLTVNCSADKMTLYRDTREAWSWAIGAGGYGEPTGSSCIGPLLVHPPYKDLDLFPGCLRIVDEPLIEEVLPPAVLGCVVPQGIDGTFPGICGGTGFSNRVHKYRLLRKDRETNATPIVNWCKELKEGNLEWVFMEVVSDTGIRPGTIMYHETDGTIFYNKNLPDASGFYPVTGVTGSGNATYTPGRYEAAGSFTRAATPLTVRPEFYMSLGNTTVVCPDAPTES